MESNKILVTVHRDYSHFGGSDTVRLSKPRNRNVEPKSAFDIEFKERYERAIKDGYKNDSEGRNKLFQRLVDEMAEYDGGNFGYVKNRVQQNIIKLSKAEKQRLVRGGRKVAMFLERWTHFITVTYSDEKMTEAEFTKKLNKLFSNLSYLFGWYVSGKYERGEGGRWHFHGFARILPGSNFSKIEEVSEYNPITKRKNTRYVNLAFEERFGRTDFIPIHELDLKNTNLADYVFKYINKSEGKNFYSRGLPSQFQMEISEDDILAVTEHEIEYVDKKTGEKKTFKKYTYVFRDDLFDTGNGGFNLDFFKLRYNVKAVS